MMQLQRWFNGLNKKQLILIRIVGYLLSIGFISYGLYESGFSLVVGIMLITALLYLEFGKENK
jgi:hypothetical protein